MPLFLSIFPKMFVLKIVTDFASAHSLRNYPGDCARLHGHNWQVVGNNESDVKYSSLSEG